MDMLKQLQALRDKIKPVEVETKSIGTVQLLPLFMSHRMKFHTNKDIDMVLLTISLSIAKNGARLVDSMDEIEVMGMLDPLGCTEAGMEDILTLYNKAKEISMLGESEVEDASKN